MNKTLIRTISIKLDIDRHEAALRETQKRFNEAASWIASICWEEHITNTNTAHHRVYGETRSRFGIGAQLAVCARAKAVEAIKATKAKKSETCPQFGPRGSIRYDARTFRLMSLDRVSLNTMQGRVICPMILRRRQHDMLIDRTWKIGGADLIWRRGIYYLNVTQSKDAPEETETSDTLGVDLGIVNLATDSEGESFSGAEVKAVRTRKAIALEDLRGIRERTTVRRVNRYERHSWAFSQLRGFMSYKAAWAGIPARFIDPRNTSRTCSHCGHCEKANRQSQASFLCKQCGFCLNADVNAAINISRVPVKVPIVSRLRA